MHILRTYSVVYCPYWTFDSIESLISVITDCTTKFISSQAFAGRFSYLILVQLYLTLCSFKRINAQNLSVPVIGVSSGQFSTCMVVHLHHSSETIQWFRIFLDSFQTMKKPQTRQVVYILFLSCCHPIASELSFRLLRTSS